MSPIVSSILRDLPALDDRRLAVVVQRAEPGAQARRSREREPEASVASLYRADGVKSVFYSLHTQQCQEVSYTVYRSKV